MTWGQSHSALLSSVCRSLFTDYCSRTAKIQTVKCQTHKQSAMPGPSTLPLSLQASARSAYRAVLRSANLTFAGPSSPPPLARLTTTGDPSRLSALTTAVRQTFSSPTLTRPTSPSQDEDVGTDEIARRIEEWKEVAVFLRRNVVQGEQGSSGAWSECLRSSRVVQRRSA